MSEDTKRGVRAILVVIAAIVVLSVVLVMGLASYVRTNDRTWCAQYSIQTNRETRFVEYTWWDWDCLTPQSDGEHWISVQRLRKVVD